MVEAWILTIFCLFLCIPIVISERQKPTQRQKYDAVVKHMLMISLNINIIVLPHLLIVIGKRPMSQTLITAGTVQEYHSGLSRERNITNV